MDYYEGYVFVSYKDLKHDIKVDVTFECFEDCLKFFSMFNLKTINIIQVEVFNNV